MSKQLMKEYERLAPNYDRCWASYVACCTHETLKRLPLVPGKRTRLLDLGCGTGALLQAILARFPLVEAVGIDPSPAMLVVAGRRLPEHVQLIAGWAEELPFTAEQFDVVVSCSAFHYFDRPRKALDEMKRVLKPHGQIVITDWCDDFFFCKICGQFLRMTKKSFHELYGTAQCIRLLGEAGFQCTMVDRYKIDWLWGMMTIQATR
jgi:ubiquinone/menaquinone biosynthesis C-methylase UbiE